MASTTRQDVAILRELAREYLEVCHDPVQAERRRLWRDHNALIATRPLIYTRISGGLSWEEVPEIRDLQCLGTEYRSCERQLRMLLFRASVGDDSVFEPWLTVDAVHRCSGWGLSSSRHTSEEGTHSFKIDYALKELGDLDKLRPPQHEIDEAATSRIVQRVQEAVGDILPVNVSRAPAYRMWTGDIATDLGFLRGIENFMLDMMDNPQWLHRLLAFMRDGILRTHDQAEQAGDWGLGDHQNQSMPYASDLDDPAANARGVGRGKLWYYMAAQEFELVSPAMHEEFLLQYQRPILEKFGLTAYGCCEDLTRKIDMLRSIPNLRRIAAAPRANLRELADQVGTDYVISWRPNPAQMVCCGFDPQSVRRILRDAMEACRGLHVDITLKDITTVENQPQRFAEWTKIAREVADEFA
jgi:hypothetical protein